MIAKTFILENKNIIPSIGFGTWKLPNNEDTISIISNAYKCGYRHFDTAFAYGNEEIIGKCFKKLNREELFITGKLWNDDRDNIVEACKRTIKNLNCKYLDLYLIHWPASKALYDNWEDINNKVWADMEYLYNNNYVKAIGVCNFKKNQLESLIKNCKIKPMVNQIEIHPGQFPLETINYCRDNNIIVEAWSPLGSGKVFKVESLNELASKYNVSVAQICIKWCLQNDILPLPKSTDIDRMKNNLDMSFIISDEDMKLLNELPYVGGSGLDSETLTLFK